MTTDTINGILIGYDETGAGPPVIWVHGGFTDRRGFDLVAPLLAGRYRVIAYDRRGHSQSERRPGTQRVAQHVDDLVALIRHRGAAPAHLVANSDGGEVATKVALRHPERVASLSLHEPALPGVLPDEPELRRALADQQQRLDRVVAELQRGEPEVAARLLVESVAMGPGAWDSLPEQTRRTLAHNGPTWLETALDPEYGRVDPDAIAALDVPVLVSDGGGGSDPVDVAIVAHLATVLPDVRRHTFAGAGHVPHRTHPQTYASVVGGFLDSLRVGRRIVSS
jgi:pimeloyl-ACP methyl ester carboxylesterase